MPDITRTYTFFILLKLGMSVDWVEGQEEKGDSTEYTHSKATLVVVIGASNHSSFDTGLWGGVCPAFLGISDVSKHRETQVSEEYERWHKAGGLHSSGCSRHLGIIAASPWTRDFWSYLWFLVQCEYDRHNVTLYIDTETLGHMYSSCLSANFDSYSGQSGGEASTVVGRDISTRVIGDFCFDMATGVTVGVTSYNLDSPVEEDDNAKPIGRYLESTYGWLYALVPNPFKSVDSRFIRYMKHGRKLE